MKVLLVNSKTNSDNSIEKSVRSVFKESGYSLDVLDPATHPIHQTKLDVYDMVVVGITEDNFFEHPIREIRAQLFWKPIFVIIADSCIKKMQTEEGLSPEKVLSSMYNAGADDYLKAPFANREFLARVQAMTKTPRTKNDLVLDFGVIAINRLDASCTIRGKRAPLRGKEYLLLEYLLLRLGTCVDRTTLCKHMGIYDCRKLFGVHLCSLRKKIGSLNNGVNYIETIEGSGLRIRGPKLT